jgi:hypothetical protein
VSSFPARVSPAPSSPIAQTIKTTVSALISEPATPRRIHVTDTPQGVDVSLHIGVDADESAAGVCRAVYDAIEASLAYAGQQVAAIRIKVGRIS